MPNREKKFVIEQGDFGSLRIRESGRCSGILSVIQEIEEKCTRNFELVPIPHAKGVVLKPLDGTDATIVEVEPPTMRGRKYKCVKIFGRCWPFAPLQSGGVYDGETVLQYEIIYQQVGDPNA